MFVLLLSGCFDGGAAPPPPVSDTDGSAPTTDSNPSTPDSGPEHVGGVTAPPLFINELVAENTGSVLAGDGKPADWLELYNPGDTDISLAGYFLSDDWRIPDLFELGDDVVIAAGGYLVFWVDGDTPAGPDHLNFELSNDGEAVGLFSPQQESVDWVLFPSLGDDVAHARVPDGSETWLQVASGTPGSENVNLLRETVEVVAKGSEWAYHDLGQDLGVAWRAPAYNDAAWKRGPGPLGYGDSQVTQISYGSDSGNKNRTAYFRSSFILDEDPSWVSSADMGVQRDDGAIVYLNGVEVLRTAMSDGDVTYDTLANTTASSTDETTYFAFDIDETLLVQGTNYLAAEVHQVDPTSSDLAFDLTLELIGLSEP
jgi:hypothetical protein